MKAVPCSAHSFVQNGTFCFQLVTKYVQKLNCKKKLEGMLTNTGKIE